MDEMDDLLYRFSRNDVQDDSNTLYVNKDYIDIQKTKYICNLVYSYADIHNVLNYIDHLEENGFVYWKLKYNDIVYCFRYTGVIEFYSDVLPEDDPNNFLERFMDLVESPPPLYDC
ncbi:hypothetical protein SAGO17_00109 [Mimivirus AB-566-O17]|uniref:Uncharacterized protein n=1 Tax=Mimivirus AB-566-O17 TaxID=1988039 RepID=A0A1X9VNY3_9VIRU|nr:hypothetical protein SAGO17_00109 [Mimivirus AB-566-O17]